MKYIEEYGIVANTDNVITKEIQYAIDECAKEGMTLYFRKGVYKTGTLNFKSNLKIHLEKGACILGSENIDDYSDNNASFVDGVDVKRGKALVLCYECRDVEISGEGEICGNGDKFNELDRPFLFRVVSSEGISLDGITLKNSAAWCLHINKSTDICVKNIHIDSKVNANNDGIDIDSSRNVLIENCNIKSGDDAVCIKATSMLPSCNITVRSCNISSGWAGFKIGTETVGDIYNIKVIDCYMCDVQGGGIKMVPTDGSNVSDIYISDIKMKNCTGPVFITLGERLRKYDGIGRDTFSTIKNITIKNIDADVNKAQERGIVFNEVWGNSIGGIIISGTQKNMIENITLENISASLPGGIEEYSKHGVKYIGKEYPEFHRMDVVPAKGIYMRDAINVKVENLNFTYKEEDIREEIIFENVL